MGFPWLLQRYIFREMTKAFVLAGAALTATLGLGGGVLNMIKLGDVTPEQLLRLMGITLPVAAALTLPIAALFSATSTYGRISADNEFVACRSSGINLHVLFLPCILLSLLTAGASFLLINFVIPQMVRHMDEFITQDVGALIQQRLHDPRGLMLGKNFRLHADEAVVETTDPDQVTLHHIVFVELDGTQWQRYGTAREVRLRFDRPSHGPPSVSGAMRGISFYDPSVGRFVDMEEQLIPTNSLPEMIPLKLKFLTFGELQRLKSHPEEWPRVADATDRLRAHLIKRSLFDRWERQWLEDGGHTLILEDSKRRLTFHSKAAQRLPREEGIELTVATFTEVRENHLLRGEAERIILEVPGDNPRELVIRVDVHDATLAMGEQRIRKPKATLGPVDIPDRMVAEVNAINARDLLERIPATGDSEEWTQLTAAADSLRAAVLREIKATIHERTAFSASVLFLVALGAALGIVFRGAHAMVAFGISFVPALVTIIAIVTGKQMAQNAPTFALGIAVLWSGITLAAIGNLWIMTRVLRR